MPYIGNTSPSRFVSNRAASVYSGDGSTTAFTLEQAVVQDEDVLVSVDGVIQEPSVAYAVSNGTTLTFTAAPSSNSGNNIFVYYLASQVGTVGHPSNQALTATTGTLTSNATVGGTLGVTGATTLSSDVTIGDASAADKKILFDGNAQDYHIGLDDSADSLTIGLGSTLGTTSHMIFDANGHITKPLQPAFGAIGSSTPTLPINTTYVLPLDLERFDQNADYNTSNYTFTAPVTGRYQLNGSIYLYNYLDTSAGYMIFTLRTSNDEYQNPVQASMFGSDIGSFGMNISHLVDMDANDTAVLDIFQQAGAAQATISGGHSHFTGFLVA